MKKQITQKEAKEKYGVVISKMQHISHTKFYLLDNGNVIDSCGDIRYIADPNSHYKKLNYCKEHGEIPEGEICACDIPF